MPKFLVTCHATATIAEDWLVTASSAEAAQEMVEDGVPDTNMILIDERTVGDEMDREVVQIAAFEVSAEAEAHGVGVIRSLTCCCCGGGAERWAQHWNRDRGYGICRCCVEGPYGCSGPDELASLFGTEGVNYAGPAIRPADAEARVEALKTLWRGNSSLSASLSLTDKLHAIAAARKSDAVVS